MRNLCNLCFFIATLFITNVQAAEKLSVEITNESVVNVSLTNVKKGERLVLKDTAGHVLYNTTLEAASAYRKFFNFSKVANGIYFIETETDQMISNTPIIKNDNGVSLLDNSAVTIFKPQVKVEGKKLKLMFMNTEKAPMTLRIYDVKDVLLIESEENTELIFNKTFDFSAIPLKGKYTVQILVGDRSLIKKVTL